MPRNPPRKTNIRMFSEETMRRAVEAVLTGRSIRSVAKAESLSFQTLARYVKKKKAANENASIRYTPHYDVNRVFTQEQENSFADYIIRCSQMFYGLSLVDCRKLAYEMATTNNIKIPPSWQTNETAGEEWIRNFMRRHPNISLRTPEGCSLARATSFNPHNVNTFLNNLHDVINRHERFCDGTRIYNLDETATVTVQKSAKVLAVKGVKQVNKVTSGEKGTLVTTCAIISAAGNHLPPAMVFPRVHFKEHMIAGAPPGTLGLAAPSGWMNSELFLKVIEHFIKYACSSNETPTLLLYDNHESHLSINVLNLAKAHGVTILTFPPHSTNKLQPLDVGLFKPFNLAYNAAVDSWLMQHPGKPLSIYEVAACVGEAYNKAMTPANITSAFKKCGIFPYDRDVFTELDFLPSSVTDRPAPDLVSGHQTPPPLQDLIDASTSQNVADGRFISPEEMRGYPKAEARKQMRQGRRKGRSMIPTDTPEKDELESRQNKKQTSVEKQKKKAVKRKIHESDDDEGKEEAEWKSDESDYMVEVDPTAFEELERTPEVGDYVLTEFEPENPKSKTVYFIGQLLTALTDENECEITFLRRSKKVDGKFFFPDIPDTAIISQFDIKMILPPPTNYGKTKRQNAYFSFEINFNSINLR